jgi:acetylornithine/succinyldiaminopimelate/putrescine aminotransferase
MIGVELSIEAAPVLAEARARGVLLTLGAPKVLRILPPLIASKENIAEALSVLSEALKTVTH